MRLVNVLVPYYTLYLLLRILRKDILHRGLFLLLLITPCYFAVFSR